ncbi:hypothetical protein LAZ67_16002773 [Cordylochernes scorpioides]|uniref:Uncharacterized protein n=1 Tax=Cordylochernes scorpioides TaxID=51811 RepID=A0ABY6LGF0_9ARAC|nr:hypothetical protein LAZ67_16002773 [Cordylochernes scorpioides]
MLLVNLASSWITTQISSSGKVMGVFWDGKGILLIDYLEKGKTITGISYERKNTSRVAEWTRHLPGKQKGRFAFKEVEKAVDEYFNSLPDSFPGRNTDIGETLDQRLRKSSHHHRCSARRKKPKEIVDFLKLLKTTVYRVKKQFDDADSNKEGMAACKKHSSRSDRVRGEEFVKNVKKIDGNPRKSMRAIAKEIDIGSITIVRTIHENLGLNSYALHKGHLLTEYEG